MDKTDRTILSLLQRDGDLSAEQIGEKVGLSKAPCWRRIKHLRDSGVIRKIVALLEPAKLNVGTTVFVMIKTSKHSTDWLEKFSRAIQHLPEVTEIHRMSGDVDYLVRIMVPDIAGYDTVYKKMIGAVEMSDVSLRGAADGWLKIERGVNASIVVSSARAVTAARALAVLEREKHGMRPCTSYRRRRSNTTCHAALQNFRRARLSRPAPSTLHAGLS